MTTTGNTQGILLIGATSAIARECGRLYASRGCSMFLVARNAERLETLKKDLEVRGARQVGTLACDLVHFDQHAGLVDAATSFLDKLDLALICHGSLPDQNSCANDFLRIQQEVNANGLSVISLLTHLAPRFVQQKSGCIAVITSVAGDRGRRSNFVYGAAKALVSSYLQGLRGELADDNVHVVDIRPGLVDSPMTAHLPKGLLWSRPEKIASIIVAAIDRRRYTVYAPFYWRPIMLIVRSIPDFIFKRLKF